MIIYRSLWAVMALCGGVLVAVAVNVPESALAADMPLLRYVLAFSGALVAFVGTVIVFRGDDA